MNECGGKGGVCMDPVEKDKMQDCSVFYHENGTTLAINY